MTDEEIIAEVAARVIALIDPRLARIDAALAVLEAHLATMKRPPLKVVAGEPAND